jgi:DNA primase
VEGQFDLILAHQSGLPFAVALSGTALTQEHLSILGRLSKRLVLALDADAAGLRSGLKSTHMAFLSGFEVKVPVFPEGKDPADVARENPELLKASVRTSKTAVSFFLDALRPGARDMSAYAKIVEQSVLPLLSVVQSDIERDQYIRLVAERLEVSEVAVRAEVAKKPLLPPEPSSISEVFLPEMILTPVQKKAGMLLFRFGRDSAVGAKLIEYLGEEALAKLETELASEGESLRFRFDAEVGEHTSEETIAADMLSSIEKASARQRFKMKFL